MHRDTRSTNDEEGTSIWLVLAGVFLAAVITALFVIPNLLGARAAAENGAAAHNLQVGLVAFKTFFSREDNFANISPLAMDSYEPSLGFTTGSSTGPKSVSFAVSATGDSIDTAAKSATGNCYYVLDVERASTNHPTAGDFYSHAVQPSTCIASSSGAATGNGDGSGNKGGSGSGNDGSGNKGDGGNGNKGGNKGDGSGNDGSGHKCHTDHESKSGEQHEHFC